VKREKNVEVDGEINTLEVGSVKLGRNNSTGGIEEA
jgi:hypothetical protein